MTRFALVFLFLALIGPAPVWGGSLVDGKSLDEAIENLRAQSYELPWEESKVLLDLFEQQDHVLSDEQRGMVYFIRARVSALSGDVGRALSYTDRARELVLSDDLNLLLAAARINYYSLVSDYVGAFGEMLQAQEEYMGEARDATARALYNSRRSYLYRRLGLDTLALSAARQSLTAAEVSGDPQIQCDAWVELISAREAMAGFRELEQSARQALAICERAQSPVFVAVLRQMVGTYLLRQGRLEEAVAALRQALVEMESLGFQTGVLETRVALGRALEVAGEYREAAYILHGVIHELFGQPAWEMLLESHSLLSTIAEARGDPVLALAHHQASLVAWEKQNDVDMAIQAAYHQAQFEHLQQQQRLSLTRQQHRQQVLERNQALGGAALLLVLSLVILSRYRLKHRSERAVARRNQELEALSQLVRQVNQKYALQEVLSPLLRWALDTMTEVDYGEMLVRDWRHRRFRVLVNAGTVARPIVATPAADDGLLAQINASRCLADGVYLMDSFTRESVQSEPDAWPSQLPLVIVTIPGTDEIDGVMLFGREDGRRPHLSDDDVDRLKRIRRHVTSALGHSQQAEDLHVEKHRGQRAMSRLRATARALEKGAEDAERANQEKAIFLSRISHELRTPLHAIIGYSQKLGRGLARHPNNEGTAAVDHIRSSGEHLLSLIESLMDLSSIEGQHKQRQNESIHLSGFIEDTAAIVRPQLEANGNRLHVYCDSLLDEMETDPVKLRQILFNLLSNSAKFTHNGHVELNVQPGSRQCDDVETVQFQVRDSGIGISQSQQEQIFDPFHRGDDQQAGRYSGTGLGLSVTRSLCECLDGDISVSSRPGQGSLFLVTLPRTPGDSVSASEQDQQRKVQPSGPRLLVVEDNRINRELMLEYLRMEGFELLAAEDGQSGLEMTRAHCPDLILMDLNLPRLSGVEAARMIRADADTRHIPIIAVSADASRSTRDMAMKAGCDAYEVKPVDFPGLLARIRSALP